MWYVFFGVTMEKMKGLEFTTDASPSYSSDAPFKLIAPLRLVSPALRRQHRRDVRRRTGDGAAHSATKCP
jgi:hypothetical protein